MLKAQVGKMVVSKKIHLAPRESVQAEMPPMVLAHPERWWPYPLGPQNLQRLQISFEASGRVSDRQEVTFGIREVTSEIDAQKHRLFKINGKNILIRGGGWTQDMSKRNT